MSASENKAWYGSDDECGVLVFAPTRGKARARVTSELGHDFTCSGISINRAPKADHLAELRERPSLSDLRVNGFTDETGSVCDGCGLGDPSDGSRRDWIICMHCSRCGECGHHAECEDRP